MEKTIVHELTTEELNPLFQRERTQTLPNGLELIYTYYIYDKDEAVVEIHHYLEPTNKYTIRVVPSRWLNDVEFCEKMQNEYFVKYVHQSDMSENS
jgi:hypothetical protein